MTMMDDAERAERRARQRELADRLKASGALDGIFEQIDGGQVPLGGDEGLLRGMLKAALERGLEVELTDHVGYEPAIRMRRCFRIRATAPPRRWSPARSARSIWRSPGTATAPSLRSWCRRVHGGSAAWMR